MNVFHLLPLAPVCVPVCLSVCLSSSFSNFRKRWPRNSKAFDSVRHHTLMSKICTYPVPDCFHNWLADYLTSRTHQTTVLENKSTFLPINASIIQGSGLGPVCYIFNSSDLHTLHPTNLLVKYADDTYLIVPGTNSSLYPQ